jgi:hypothetical protein
MIERRGGGILRPLRGTEARESNENHNRRRDYCGLAVTFDAGKRIMRLYLLAATIGVVVALFCQCQRRTPVQAPTPTPEPAPTLSQSPEALLQSPEAKPTPTPVPTPTPSATPTVAAATPDPNSLEEGMKRIMAASESGFLELRGKFKKTENGTGASPLFRVRKLYEGSFVFGGASSAELEEVYYRKDGRPSYNYRLFFPSPPKESAEKYDDLMVRLQQMLTGFEHTHASGYDAWARSDAANTAVLLSVQEQPGLLQVQVHVAFPAPKW